MTLEQHRQDADAAFTYAIHQGRLCASDGHPLYAGDFMFMGRAADGRDTFKNRNTRAYLDNRFADVRPELVGG